MWGERLITESDLVERWATSTVAADGATWWVPVSLLYDQFSAHAVAQQFAGREWIHADTTAFAA
jgi:hypothetical protein